MQLKTYTSLWNVEKRIYKFYDVNLPFPISVKQIGLTIAIFIPWLLLMNLLHVPFSAGIGSIMWLGPPAGLIFFAIKVPLEDRPLLEFAVSQIRFFLSPRERCALQPMAAKPVARNVTSRVRGKI